MKLSHILKDYFSSHFKLNDLQEALKREKDRIELNAGSSTSSTGSLTFCGLSEPPLSPLPSPLLEILVPLSTLICLFMLLLYLSTAGELNSIFYYFLCI